MIEMLRLCTDSQWRIRAPLCMMVMLLVLFVFSVDPAHAQLSHADSVLAHSIPSILPANQNSPWIVTGDSTLSPLLSLVPSPSGLDLPIFFIEQLTATVSGTKTNSTMDISVQGALITTAPNSSRTPNSSRRFYERTIDTLLTDRDWDVLETNGDRYVHFVTTSEKSVWSSVLEPALVVLGAAAIVALFFLVRS